MDKIGNIEKGSAHPKLKVLIVDDEPDKRQLIAFALEHAGYEVHTADDGEAGLAVVTPTFCCNFTIRRSRSAPLLVNGTTRSVMKRRTSWRWRSTRLTSRRCGESGGGFLYGESPAPAAPGGGYGAACGGRGIPVCKSP